MWVIVIIAIYGWIRFAYPRALKRLLGLTFVKPEKQKMPSSQAVALNAQQLEELERDPHVRLIQSDRQLKSNLLKKWSLYRHSLIVHLIALMVVGFAAGAALSTTKESSTGLGIALSSGIGGALIFGGFQIMGVAHLYGLISQRSIYVAAAVIVLMVGVAGLFLEDTSSFLSLLGIVTATSLYLTFFFSPGKRGAMLLITMMSLPTALFSVVLISLWQENHHLIHYWPITLNRILVLLHNFRYEGWQVRTLGIVVILLIQASTFIWIAVKNYDEGRTSDMELAATSGVLFLFNSVAGLYFLVMGVGVLFTGRTEVHFYVFPLLLSLGVFYYLLLDWLHSISGFGATSPKGISLLVLRVFTHDKRTRRLFENLANLWRFFGPVYIVSGYEVAMHTMSPRSFLLFITRRLERLCFRSDSSLETLLQRLGPDRFREGSFRVHDILCDDKSWQEAFGALLERANKVLLDLRGITAGNAGILYELEEVNRVKSPGQFVILIDGTSDLQVIRYVISRQADRGEDRGLIPFVEIERSDLKESKRICSVLAGST
jgi:hypothetical protein